MRINHNIPALNSYRNLSGNTSLQGKSMEKLSSGLRINRAADDAAGLAISETMRGQIKGLNQASRNSQDAISLIQTAEGALTETHSILHRMRELSVQSSNDTYTSNDRVEMQKEIDQLKDEVDRIANTTTFNNKTLLDGTAAALTSTDKTTTKVFMRGGLRTIDSFGIKSAGAGDYKLDIAATAGTAQIQKSNVFKNNHTGDTVQDLAIDESSGITNVDATDIAKGAYQVATSANVSYVAAVTATATVAQYFAATGSTAGKMVSGDILIDTSALANNASILVEVSGVAYDVDNLTATQVTLQISWYTYDEKGDYLNINGTYGSSQPVMLNTTSITVTSTVLGAGLSTNAIMGAINLSMDIVETGIALGDKMTINLQGYITTGDNAVEGQHDVVTIKNSTDVNSATYTNTAVQWAFDDTELNNTTKALYFFSLDSSGNAGSGKVDLTSAGLATTSNAATFTFQEGQGQVASLSTQLKNVDKFTDANGKFLLDSPQILTMVQGDGTKTSITLYGTDTIRDVRDKLNAAIADGLGQKDLVDPNDADNFVSYVSKADATGVESTEGTFVIRSAKAGTDGEINFVGNEQLINALGLSDAQSSTESKFTVNVTNASNDDVIASGVSIQGNLLIGVVHPNVDVKFDSNADIKVTWDTAAKSYSLAGDQNSSFTTFVHLVDNTQVFQIGANQMQDMGSAIGNMNSESLGIKNIIVTDRDSAGRAITVLDDAISRVSSQRSTLGAVQNRLEHTINNLGVAGENLTASESRIRDVDMASEMMEFSKLNILSQAATAMLAQANQQPQQVMQLIGR